MTACTKLHATRITFSRVAVLRVALWATALVFLGNRALAQGPPQLTVDARAYHVLIPPGTALTASVCQPFDTQCLANASHSPSYPLFKQPTAFATDAIGNVYVADSGTGQILKLSASGKAITLLAGSLSAASYGFPPATGLAVKLGLTNPTGIAIDLGGNLYVTDSNEENAFGFGSLIKIDPFGIATRLTATYTLNPADPIFLDGAQSTSQLMNPTAVAVDPSGNAYVVDRATCTVRKYAPNTGILTVIAGTLATGCGAATSAPTPTQAAKTYSFASITGVAVGADSTVYLTDSTYAKLFSVTTDGLLHVLAGTGSKQVIAGPSSSTGDIGEPYNGLAVDASGGLYFASLNYATLGFSLIEVTKGTATSPSQVLNLSGPYSIASNFTDNTNLEGAPAKLSSLNGLAGIGLDPFGRLLIATPGNDGIAYLDRNGTAILNASSPSPLSFTYTNTGGSPLTGIAYAGTSLPYSISPTAAQIIASGESGPAPFQVDPTTGTCPAKLNSGFSLAPGESCTLTVEYTPNPNIPSVGSLTFFTNDPAGPQTVLLSSTRFIAGASGTPPQFNISSMKVIPTASTSKTSTFSIHTSVSSHTTNGHSAPPANPTAPIVLGLTYLTNGATVQYQQATPDANGNASFTFTNLPSGNYTMTLQAVYEGSASTQPAFSPVQYLYVTHINGIDFTNFPSLNPRINYEGATPQFLNFVPQAYTIPAPALIEDLYAGNNPFTFTLSTASGAPIDPTSPTILPVGSYKVLANVANATALDYSVTTHSGNFVIDPADLTVLSVPTGVVYGQYLTSGTPDTAHFSLSTRWSIGTSATIAAPDLLRGAITLTSSIQSPPLDATIHFLAPGNYTILPILSGPGATNYTFTAISSVLNVSKADLTLNGSSFSTTAATTLHVADLCDSCYTAPNSTLLTTDPNLTVQVKLTGPNNATVTYPYSTSTGFTLAPGTWTSTFLVSGSGATNYTETLHAGTVTVQ